MSKEPKLQLDFDFQAPQGEVRSIEPAECSVPTPVESATAPVYSLKAHRDAKLAREAETHYSAILELVSHFK